MRVLKHLLVYLVLISVACGIHQSSSSLPFEVIKNSGFIFGLFEEASFFIRVGLVALAIGPLILVALYFYTTLASELTRLRWGITFFLGGILGNSFEKLLFGFVYDYGRLDLPILRSFSFNASDVSQLLGLAIIIWQLFSRQDQVWFPSMQRRSLIIYPDIQIPALLRILIGAFLLNLTQLLLTITLVFPLLRGPDRGIIGLYFLILLGVGIILFFVLGRLILREFSRCLGPVASIERYIEAGDLSGPLRFRKSHHFSALEESINSFLNRIRKKEG